MYCIEKEKKLLVPPYHYLGYMNLENAGVNLFQEYWNAWETTSKIFRSNMLSASLKGLTQRTVNLPCLLGPEAGYG